MEDFSFSLNEAKPKHFGLEMFVIVVLVSWSLPCLLPFSFPVGLLPTALCFPQSIPVTGRAESCNTSGDLDPPRLFVIFMSKFFCVKKKSQCFLRHFRRELFSWWQRAETPLSVCVVLPPSCGQGCCCVCVTRSFSTPTRCCSVTNPFSLLHHSQKLGTSETSPASFCTGLQATLSNHPEKAGKVSSWTFAMCSFSAHIFAWNHDLSLRR